MRTQEVFALKRGSFTLIELLVVISIVSVIATFLFVNIRSGQSKARDAQRVTDLELLNNAIQMYYRGHGHFPSLPENCGFYSEDYGWANGSSTANAPYQINPSERDRCVSDEFILGLKPSFIASLPSDSGPPYNINNLNARGIVYSHYLPNTSTGNRECYKLILWFPENRNNQKYKRIWDPARDGGPNDSKLDGSDISAWSMYSAGCAAK